MQTDFCRWHTLANLLARFKLLQHLWFFCTRQAAFSQRPELAWAACCFCLQFPSTLPPPSFFLKTNKIPVSVLQQTRGGHGVGGDRWWGGVGSAGGKWKAPGNSNVVSLRALRGRHKHSRDSADRPSDISALASRDNFKELRGLSALRHVKHIHELCSIRRATAHCNVSLNNGLPRSLLFS